MTLKFQIQAGRLGRLKVGLAAVGLLAILTQSGCSNGGESDQPAKTTGPQETTRTSSNATPRRVVSRGQPEASPGPSAQNSADACPTRPAGQETGEDGATLVGESGDATAATPTDERGCPLPDGEQQQPATTD